MKKRNISLSSLVAVLIISLAIPIGFPGLKAGAASKRKKAVTAYTKMLSRDTITWASGNKVSTKKLRFALNDINRDGTPELILENPDAGYACGWNRIYTFYKGKVRSMGKKKSILQKMHENR